MRKYMLITNNFENNKNFLFQQEINSQKLNLFCFHHAGGTASLFYDWSNTISSLIQLICIQLPGRETRYKEQFSKNFNTILDELMYEKKLFTGKPFALFGYSLGAIIAFEFARKLQTNNIFPMYLIVAGCSAPKFLKNKEKIAHLSDKDFIDKLNQTYGGFDDEILSCQELLELLLPRIRADISLYESYLYSNGPTLECPIFVLYGNDDPSTKYDELLAWKEETQKTTQLYKFDGNHFFVVSAKNMLIHRLNIISEMFL